METTLARARLPHRLRDHGRTGIGPGEESRPAAVVLDLMMPGMDGFEFLERFREHHRRTATSR